MEFHHVSILLQPCLDALNIKPDGVYVDATTGGAGHSLRIASALGEGGRLICIDRDDEALENAKTRLAPVWARVTTVKSDFRDIDRVLEGQGLARCGRHPVRPRRFLAPARPCGARLFLYEGRAARYAHGPAAEAHRV